MKTEYYIVDPNKNITALVTSPVQRDIYRSLSQKIMQKNPTVEQVGFVKFLQGSVMLNMSGDEFCGNAVLSAAALYFSLKGKKDVLNTRVLVSPSNISVNVSVRAEKSGFFCECELQTPENVEYYSFTAGEKSYTFPLVRLNGICHIVADNTLSEEQARYVIKQIAKDLGAKALGIMLYDKATCRLKPLVFVLGVDTLFLENSCASGSCAVAAALGEYEKQIKIINPGGSLLATRHKNSVTLSENINSIEYCLEEI